MERRVVITGLGIWSCLGTSLDEVRQSLYSGKVVLSLVRLVRMQVSVLPSVPMYLKLI